ncbi:MAG: hypothetical protein QM635_03565 [Microbacteriaceae bacterium]
MTFRTALAPIRRSAGRVLAGGLALALGASLLSAVLPGVATETAEAASSITKFDAGSIITDADMFTYSTMSAAKIQSFLDAKVSSCDSDAAVACLKDYTADVTAIAGYGDDTTAKGCEDDIDAASDVSAAKIIYIVAQACKVNPQVLLVTLQKEQGLVTSTSPTATKYKIAMGYGCPDSSGCNSTYYGFFNQVYWAARAFQSYTRFPSSFTYAVGETVEIAYSPTASCGTKTVTLKNSATAALYNYTPYTPNAAAIKAGVGNVGDSCSSYGNRNFWGYFYSWFGPVDDQDPYFIRNADTKQIYLIINGKRRPIASKHEMRLIAKYTGIAYKLPSLDGSIVSQIGTGSYRVIVPGTVIKASSSSSKLYIIDGLSTKRPITKKQAIELTGSSSALVVGSKVVAKYKTGAGWAKLGLRVGSKYWVADHGVLRRIRSEDVAHYKKKFGFGTYDVSTIKALTTGVSIGRLIEWDGHYYLVRDNKKYKISTAYYKRLAKKFGKSARTVDDYFASLLPTR